MKNNDTAGKLLFAKLNYRLMIAGVLLIVIGCAMMAGQENIFSFTKITLGPIIAMLGFIMQVFAIMYRPKKQA
jgi:uncharacterized membrane protein